MTASPTAITSSSLRTNKDFTLKTNPLAKGDLNEFIDCYNPDNRNKRKATWSENNPEGRWHSFTYEELIARDKVNLSNPDVLALEIVEDLKAALTQFESIEEELSAEE